jgi:hypothetical protein
MHRRVIAISTFTFAITNGRALQPSDEIAQTRVRAP